MQLKVLVNGPRKDQGTKDSAYHCMYQLRDSVSQGVVPIHTEDQISTQEIKSTRRTRPFLQH